MSHTEGNARSIISRKRPVREARMLAVLRRLQASGEGELGPALASPRHRMRRKP